ncbi:MAG: hypothetical protein M1833_002122 [Piccolia ochrophora]|nr:MAG: hypothetical protein M1833_002122 [Piccolia ochrophora]
MASTEQASSDGGDPTPSIAPPSTIRETSPLHSDPSSSSSPTPPLRSSSSKTRLQRPTVRGRKRSGSNIVSRNDPAVELTDEVFDEDDARCMSPRRNSEDIEKMSQRVRRELQEQAQSLQARLVALIDHVESVKCEHDKLEGENKFLQSYIGELMSTSRITATGAVKGKSSRTK